ncbi:hypothetical protein MAR_035384 [Mya arenaria]|uniref:Uncharacterized protein n=1 Tax=Mya arenaria TaxID=6604 RepID=A0ABY7EJZ1_MYAAR|nr:hypothetical protein MAR_035384 [Mya arenaria]
MSMMHKFNLLKDENIPNIINAYTGGMYNASIVPAGLGAIASDYRGKIEYVSSRTLKMRIFVAPRDASTDLEQVVLQIVKKHLRTSARNIKIKPSLPPNVRGITTMEQYWIISGWPMVAELFQRIISQLVPNSLKICLRQYLTSKTSRIF